MAQWIRAIAPYSGGLIFAWWKEANSHKLSSDLITCVPQNADNLYMCAMEYMHAYINTHINNYNFLLTRRLPENLITKK